MKKEYLNEERFQRTRKKIIMAGIIVIIVGLLIGGTLIIKGFVNKKAVENEYTEENKQEKIDDLYAQYQNLENLIQPQLDKIKELDRAKFEGFNDAYYARKDEKAKIEKEIKPIKDRMSNLSSDIWHAERENPASQRAIKSAESIPFFMIGGFIIAASFMISGVIIIQAYRRNILAYGAQATVPVAKEGIDEMAPSIGKAAGEIAKGIKKGLNEDVENVKTCPDCGSEIDVDSVRCNECGNKV